MDLPNRKSLRLKNYDYTKAGGYFITLCTHNHKWILSSVTPSTDGRRPQIILTELGRLPNPPYWKYPRNKVFILIPTWSCQITFI